MKRKLLSLITTLSIIASIAVFLPLSVHAEEIKNEWFTEDTQLTTGNSYVICKVKGSDNPDNPVVITVPEGGVSFRSFEVMQGYVKLTGGLISTIGIYPAIDIDKNACLTLENITIHGLDTAQQATIAVHGQGELIIKAGTEITMPADSDISTRWNKGAVYIYPNAKATMNGGEIHGNYEGVSLDTSTPFTMNGGKIYNNIGRKGKTGGGAIDIYTGTFIMNGGEIYNNQADGYGAFYLESGGIFTMNNGVIYGNQPLTQDSDITIELNVPSGSAFANLHGGLFLGSVFDRYPRNNKGGLKCNSSEYPMYKGTIEGLRTNEMTITDADTGAVVSGAKNGNTLFADKTHSIVDVNGNAAVYDEESSKWIFSSKPVNPEFTTTADAGYYSETRDAEDKTGIVAFNSLITNFEECKDDITKYGMYIYIDGVSDNSVQLESTSSETLMQQAGQFYATVSEIPSSDFDRTIVAMPYALSANGIIEGDICIFNVYQGNKWLGKAE